MQDLLECMYLLGETVPGQWLTRIARDPLLARYFRYVVFRQAETDFMLMPSGFITADGSAYAPDPQYLVGVPHPLSMKEDALAAFRAVPKRSKAKVPQLHEPVYDISNLPDLGHGWIAHLRSEDGKPVLVLHSDLFVPHGIRSAYEAYKIGTYYTEYEIPVRANDPVVNHILYQMDM